MRAPLRARGRRGAAPPPSGPCSPTPHAPAAARARAAAFDGATRPRGAAVAAAVAAAASTSLPRHASRRDRRRGGLPARGPTVLAFFSGGYFAEPRLIAAIVVWALVLALALTGPAPLPRTLPGRLALGGLAALTAWSARLVAWAPLAGPALESVQRLTLYLGALLLAIGVLRDRRALRARRARARRRARRS